MEAKGSFNADMGVPAVGTELKGSFGMPKAEPKKEARPKTVENVEVSPKEQEKQTQEQERQQRNEMIELLEKDLKTTISDDDIWQVLFGNTLEKRSVCIFPGRMFATFRTISMDDANKIENLMADAADGTVLKRGFDNLNTQYVVAAGVLELGKPNLAKNLGETMEVRYETFKPMSSVVVDRLSKKWGSFMTLIDLVLAREADAGKD